MPALCPVRLSDPKLKPSSRSTVLTKNSHHRSLRFTLCASATLVRWGAYAELTTDLRPWRRISAG